MRLHGLFVPLLTALARSGQIDPGAIRGHVDRMLAGGVDGLVALGTTGEFADLLPQERAQVVGAVVDACGGRAPVLAGVGAVGAAEACEHARRAADAGADAVLVLPPLYWKLSGDGLVRHYAAVCAATSLPVVLYDFPALTGSPLLPPLVERLVRELDQVVGVKLSGPELRTLHEVARRTRPHRPDFSVLVGSADLVLPALLGGADGAIVALANVDPAPFVRLSAAVAAGDLDAARREHERVLTLMAIPALARPPILALKAAARALGSPLEPVVRTEPDDAHAVPHHAAALALELLAP